jgi:hypothetical protein
LVADSESGEKGRSTDLQMHIHVQIVASTSMACKKKHEFFNWLADSESGEISSTLGCGTFCNILLLL